MKQDSCAVARQNGGPGCFALGGGTSFFLDVTQVLFIVFKGLRGLADKRVSALDTFSIMKKVSRPRGYERKYQ